MRRASFVLSILLVLWLSASPAAAADSDGDGVSNRNDRCPNLPGDRADGCPTNVWRFRFTNSAGPADAFIRFGGQAFRPLAGDWNGDGADGVGTYDPRNGRFRLVELEQSGFSVVAEGVFISPVPTNAFPIAGDFNGDGLQTVGLWEPSTGTWYLRDLNTPGAANTVFTFGGATTNPLIQPVAGDWEGDGRVSIGLFNRGTGVWRLRFTNTTGPRDLNFSFGEQNPTGPPQTGIAGDWDGNSTDTVGVGTPSGPNVAWALRNANAAGPADVSFTWGPANGSPTPVAGNWDDDGGDNVGLRRTR